jgi:hypothetical protein
MALIVNGSPEDVPGLVTRSWLDDSRFSLTPGEDVRRRGTTWIRSIVLHTTKGLPAKVGDPEQKILPGLGPDTDLDNRIARLWSTDGRNAGAHLAVDHDGAVSCHADLQTEAAFHAGAVNDVSIGIEIYQGGRGELYAGQLDAVVVFCDWLTRRFGIQRQIPHGYQGRPIARLERGAKDYVGLFGHRDCSDNRGAGDPGDAVFAFLYRAGYERHDVERGDDLVVWKARQALLGIAKPDGVPGPKTVAAVARDGRARGMWVARPGDE